MIYEPHYELTAYATHDDSGEAMYSEILEIAPEFLHFDPITGAWSLVPEDMPRIRENVMISLEDRAKERGGGTVTITEWGLKTFRKQSHYLTEFDIESGHYDGKVAGDLVVETLLVREWPRIPNPPR